MKVAFVMDQILACGGVKIPFGYVRELKKLGFEADIYANGRNEDLERYYGIIPKPISELSSFSSNDVIIAVWWMQVEELEKYKGIKIQFVQGNDPLAYTKGESLYFEVKRIRKKLNWEILAVSDYAGSWTGRKFTVIPNAIDDVFFEELGMERDIDALIEGNNEPNKNIDYSINLAKSHGHKKIVWLGRETKETSGVETITNPPQNEIPSIYQRSKNFYKHSLSEGFCLPIIEAMASGCEIFTQDMGGNNFLPYTKENAKNFSWDKSVNKLMLYLTDLQNTVII